MLKFGVTYPPEIEDFFCSVEVIPNKEIKNIKVKNIKVKKICKNFFENGMKRKTKKMERKEKINFC